MITSVDFQRKDKVMLSDEEQLNLAYDWLIKRRKLAPHNADIWDVRFRWNEANPRCIKSDFLRSLQHGTYRLSPMLQVGKKGIILWSALNALALKWVELGIRDVLPLHQRCEHIKGYGGGISSAHRLQAIIQQGHYQYVCRTDIKGYYGAIDKTLLQSQLEKQIKPWKI